jgi:hypothetical protein
MNKKMPNYFKKILQIVVYHIYNFKNGEPDVLWLEGDFFCFASNDDGFSPVPKSPGASPASKFPDPWHPLPTP